MTEIMEERSADPAAGFPAGVVHFLVKPDGGTERSGTGFGRADQDVRVIWNRRGRVPAEPALKVSTGGETVAIIWRQIAESTSATAGRRRTEEQRIEKVCEWRKLDKAVRTQIRASAATRQRPWNEVEAQRLALAYRDELAGRVREAERDCWEMMRKLTGLSEGTRYEPFWHRTAFSARDCLRFPITDKCRIWFRSFTEYDAVETVMEGTADRRAGRSWAQRHQKIAEIAEEFAMADFAWATHVRLTADVGRGARVDDPVDWLSAWAAGEIGEQYLGPLLARQQPGVPRERHRQQLLLEVWGAVLALRPSKLSVIDFCRLPTAAAAAVRELYRDAEDDVARLQPAALRRLDDLNPCFPYPQADLMEQERLRHLEALIETLPHGQQQVIRLRADGDSYQEIADELGCGLESVKTQLARARKSLRARETRAPGRKPGVMNKEALPSEGAKQGQVR